MTLCYVAGYLFNIRVDALNWVGFIVAILPLFIISGWERIPLKGCSPPLFLPSYIFKVSGNIKECIKVVIWLCPLLELNPKGSGALWRRLKHTFDERRFYSHVFSRFGGMTGLTKSNEASASPTAGRQISLSFSFLRCHFFPFEVTDAIIWTLCLIWVLNPGIDVPDWSEWADFVAWKHPTLENQKTVYRVKDH